jgi:hypothetical protein
MFPRDRHATRNDSTGNNYAASQPKLKEIAHDPESLLSYRACNT